MDAAGQPHRPTFALARAGSRHSGSIGRRALRPIRIFVALLAGAAAPLAAADTAPFAFPNPLARLLSGDFRAADDRRLALQRDLARLPTAPDPEPTPQLGWRLYDYDSRPWRSPQWVEVDFGEAVEFDAVALLPTHLITEDFPNPGYGFPVRFRLEVFGGQAGPRLLADCAQADFPRPGSLPLWVPAPGARGRRVRLTVVEPWRNGPLHAVSLAEFMVLRGTRNLATGRHGVVVRASDSRETPPAWTRANLIDGRSPLGAPVGPRLAPGQATGHGWQSRLARTPQSEKWVQVDLGAPHPIDEVRLVPARLPQRLHLEGFGFPVRFRVEADDDPAFPSPRLIADHTREPFSNPGFNPVTLPAGLVARHVRVTATELALRGDGLYHFALGELQVYAGDANLARGAPVTYLDSLEGGPNLQAAFLTDGSRWEHPLAEWSGWLRGLSARRELQHELAAVTASLTAQRQSLTRTAAWTTGGLTAGTALLLLAGYYRLQLRRAREAEALRRQIAADLHDDLGSNLASLSLLSELCVQSRDPVPRADLEELHALARETADALRDTTWFVRPGLHTTGQFLERLRATARRQLPGLDWELDATDFRADVPIDVQRHLLLALKESLHNVARHAAARRVRIRLSAAAGGFTLVVTDDGRGFDPAAAGEGQGLDSLRHRARLLGGAARFDSTPGAGTTLTFTGRLAPPARPPSAHG